MEEVPSFDAFSTALCEDLFLYLAEAHATAPEFFDCKLR
jgi:hypothetical protein